MEIDSSQNRTFRQHVNLKFELRFLRVRGSEFQDFFAELMENACPGDFRRVRPHGNAGDFKCDGYWESKRTVFQAYGPEEIRSVAKLLKKIDDDFNGATAYWAGRMERWIFVHNSRQGLPPQAVQKLSDLRNRHDGVTVDFWGYEELHQVLLTISAERLRAMFPLAELSETAAVGVKVLPDETKRTQYWEWLRAHLNESLQASPLGHTGHLALPIRIAAPEKIEKFFGEEAQLISRIANDSTTPMLISENLEVSCKECIGIPDLPRTLKKHRCILIEGGAGAGKSTLLNSFALRETEHLLRRGPSKASRRTPVLIDLARFSPDRPIQDLVLTSVNRSGIELSVEQLACAGRRGYLLYLMDGLDEVPTEHRHECLAQILMLVERNANCKLVVSSRSFPNPPQWLYRLSIVPYSDSDIAVSLRILFGPTRVFRSRFNGYSPEDYVRAGLRPEVRQMCRSPLTLGMILSFLKGGTEIPKALFAVYEQFTSWLMNWESQTERLRSLSASLSALEVLAYALQGRVATEMPLSEWIRITGLAIQTLFNGQVIAHIDAEAVAGAILSTGLVRNVNGQIGFSHKTFQEFLVARHILSSAKPPHLDPAALDIAVARFLCSRMEDVCALLEEHLKRTEDVQTLLPLLSECSLAGCYGGRFEDLYEAIVLGKEMGIELTHGLRGPDVEGFTEAVNAMVETCVAFKPKALNVLKEAVWGIMMGTPWDESQLWFERVVVGLESYGWQGAIYHRQLLEAGYFDHLEIFDCDTEDGERAYDELRGYLNSMHDDDLDKAKTHFDNLMRALAGDVATIEEDPNQRRLPFDNL